MAVIQPVKTQRAPAAIGPYSQAVSAAGLVFVSGQLALDPQSGVLCGDTAEQQAVQVLSNIKAILEAAGSGLERVTKTTLYLLDLSEFQAVNSVYGGVFREPYPARVTLGVAALPMGARIAVDAVAVLEESPE